MCNFLAPGAPTPTHKQHDAQAAFTARKAHDDEPHTMTLHKLATMVWPSTCVTTMAHTSLSRSKFAADGPWTDPAVGLLLAHTTRSDICSHNETLLRLFSSHTLPGNAALILGPRLLTHILRATEPPTTSPPALSQPHAHTVAGLTKQHTLYFSGETEGDPGAGAAGPVLVQFGIKHTALIRAASISFRDGKMTSNVAAYHGLLNELREAADMGYSQLNVVDDNNTVISRMKEDSMPAGSVSRWLHESCRMDLSRLHVVCWTTHKLEHN